MVVMAFAVQQSEAIILKSILLYNLYKKLSAKKAVPVTPTVAVKTVPAPPVSKPVFARATAGTKPAGYEATPVPSWPAEPKIESEVGGTYSEDTTASEWPPEATVESEGAFGDGRRL